MIGCMDGSGAAQVICLDFSKTFDAVATAFPFGSWGNMNWRKRDMHWKVAGLPGLALGWQPAESRACHQLIPGALLTRILISDLDDKTKHTLSKFPNGTKIRERGWHLAEEPKSTEVHRNSANRNLRKFCKKWKFLHLWWNSLTHGHGLWSKKLNSCPGKNQPTNQTPKPNNQTTKKPSWPADANRLSKGINLLYSMLVRLHPKYYVRIWIPLFKRDAEKMEELGA